MDIVSLEASDVLPWERVSGPGDSSYSTMSANVSRDRFPKQISKSPRKTTGLFHPTKLAPNGDLILSLVLFLAV